MKDVLPRVVSEIIGPAGRLESLLDEPEGIPRAAVIFAHPHPQQGGTMHTKVVYQGAKAFKQIGCAVLRFNFRGVGLSDGSWDEGRAEMDDYRSGLDFMADRYPGVKLWAAGFSFGAWIALTTGVADPRVEVLISVAPPIQYDLSAVQASEKPKFLIHGERDELIPLKEMWHFYGQMQEPKELVVIDAADHVFDGKASEVGDAIKDLLGDFISISKG